TPAREASRAMAPRINMFYDGSLETPIYMTDWWENLEFVSSVAEIRPINSDSGQSYAARVKVALFWHNPTWDRYARDSRLLRTLDPAHGSPATLEVRSNTVSLLYGKSKFERVLNEKAFAILKRHGVIMESIQRR